MKKIPILSIRPAKPKKKLPNSARGYGADWRKASLDYRQAHPICEICNNHVSQDVDHRIPISKGGARLDWRNLQALCKPCHARKTVEDQE